MSCSFPEQQYALPVTNNGFSYHGTFYVDQDGHRHERADPKSLYALLTYTPPAPLVLLGKVQPLPHKDPPGHFYFAQLVHYGLKRVKRKAPAKKLLLDAFQANGTLTVPKNVLELEETLRQEYKEANEIAKKKFLEDEAHDIVMQDLDGDASDLHGPESAVDNNPRAQLHDAIATLPTKDLRKILVNLVDKIPEVEDEMMVMLKSSGNKAPKAKTSKKAVKASGAMIKSQKLNERELEGKFSITAPYLTEQWSDFTETMVLRICPSSTSSHLWAHFNFGIVTGVIRSSEPPPNSTGVACPFFWRGRESGEGEMSFGGRNTGSITFLGGGKIKGRMEWMDGFEFSGKNLNLENVVWYKSLPAWKSEWRGYNERAYEGERKGRWGGWVGRNDADEKPSMSDTTFGEGSESEGYGSDGCDNVAY